MEHWFSQFRYGDLNDREFQKRLIDTFVNAVFVYDDKLVLTYNYQHGTQTITLKEVEDFLGSDLVGLSPFLQKSIVIYIRGGLFLYQFRFENIKMIKNISIVSLSSGILGEDFVKFERDIGLKRLGDMGVRVKFMPNSLRGVDYLNKHPEKACGGSA